MRELRSAGRVNVKHVGTDDNPADIFTKVWARRSFEKHRRTVQNLAAGDRVESLRAARNKYDGDKTQELAAFAASRAQRSIGRCLAAA